MSKSERLREMQKEINKLKDELARKNEMLAQHQARDKPMAMDFLKQGRK